MIDDAIRAAVVAAVEPLAGQIAALTAEVAALRAASPPRLLSVDEAARALGISARSVWRRVQDGSLASQRIGRSVRVDVRDLHAEAPAAVAALALAREARRCQ